jgi:hypothetical protein
MTIAPLATGKVESLCIDGKPVGLIYFRIAGPKGDRHRGITRALSGHDGAYIRTSRLQKGSEVFNWRSWTGLSKEELDDIENVLGVHAPPGCLLENIVVSGIPNFSKLPPTSRLVFPGERGGGSEITQTILAVWEENGPCDGVGKRLEAHHGQPGLSARFIKAAQNKRGVMGLVLSPGVVRIGDTVVVYPPVQ